MTAPQPQLDSSWWDRPGLQRHVAGGELPVARTHHGGSQELRRRGRKCRLRISK